MKAAPLASNHPHIATITAEGRGRLRIRPVDVFGLLKLQLEAAKGDRDAVRLMPAVMATVLAVCNPPPGQLPTCASCGGSIGMYRRYHIGVIHAAVAAPEAALTFLICKECGWDDTAVNVAIDAAMLRHWPGAGRCAGPRFRGGEA